jgi:hypothetical protein
MFYLCFFVYVAGDNLLLFSRVQKYLLILTTVTTCIWRLFALVHNFWVEILVGALDLHHHNRCAQGKGRELVQLVQARQVVYGFEKLISHGRQLEVLILSQPPIADRPAHWNMRIISLIDHRTIGFFHK